MPDPADTAAGENGVDSSGWGGGGGNYASIGGGQGSGSSYGGGNSTNTGGVISGGTSGNYGGSNNSGSGTYGGSGNYGGSNNTGSSGLRGPESSWGTRGTMGTSSSPPATSTSTASGGIGGALSAGLGGPYSNPISLSASADTGYSYRIPDVNPNTIPGMATPNQFDKTIYNSNLVNVYGNPMNTWSNNFDPNKLTPGAQKVYQAIEDNALRLGVPVDYFSGKRMYNPEVGTTQHSLGQAIDIRINDPVTGKPVGYDQIGNAAYNPIGSVRPGFRTPAQAGMIQDALEQPYQDFATQVIGSFYSNPGVYGPFENQRWGGAFESGAFAKDYMHFDEGKAATGVSASQQALRNVASASAQPSGPLSDPSSTGPLQLAMAGMGGAVSPSAPVTQSSPYSNILDKTDRLPPNVSEYYKTPPAVANLPNPNVTNGVLGGGGVTALPNDQRYAVAGGQGVLAVGNLSLQAPQAPQQVASVVPSWEQSSYTGPIDTVMNQPVPPSQEGEPIPYPVDEDGLGYKVWRAGTQVADMLLPGGGMMLRTMDDNLKNRWPSMTNAERQALIDQWNANNNPGGPQVAGNAVGGQSEGPKVGGDSPTMISYNQPSAPPRTVGPAAEPVNAVWKQDAIAYGFTPEQLNDPEIAAYIKQLWDMGWIPQSA